MEQETKTPNMGSDPSSDKTDMWRAATVEERLNWLEEAGEFVQAFVSPEKIRRWRQYQQKENPKS